MEKNSHVYSLPPRNYYRPPIIGSITWSKSNSHLWFYYGGLVCEYRLAINIITVRRARWGPRQALKAFVTAGGPNLHLEWPLFRAHHQLGRIYLDGFSGQSVI